MMLAISVAQAGTASETTAKAEADTAAANEQSEAIRIAEKISWAGRADIAQSEAQKDASPVYY